MYSGLMTMSACTNKVPLTKLEVFEIAWDFVSLSFRDKYDIGKHFMQMDHNMILWKEPELELAVWKAAQDSMENFDHLIGLIEDYTK